jgi:hypothetical protein
MAGLQKQFRGHEVRRIQAVLGKHALNRSERKRIRNVLAIPGQQKIYLVSRRNVVLNTALSY